MAEKVDAQDLKSCGESRAGSIPAERTIWCNTHQRYAKECKIKGGILLPCSLVDITDLIEITEYIEKFDDR